MVFQIYHSVIKLCKLISLTKRPSEIKQTSYIYKYTKDWRINHIYIHLYLSIYRQYTYIVEIYNLFVRALETGKKRVFFVLFCSEYKWIWYSPTMYIYCIYPEMLKSPKQLPNCTKSRNKRRSCRLWWCPQSLKSMLILLSFLTIAQHESSTRQATSWSVTVYSKIVFSHCNLNSQIEPVQDKN